MKPPMAVSPLDERGLPKGYLFRTGWELTPRQVKAMMDQGRDLMLLDCRTPGEQAVARIESAVLAPLHEMPDGLDQLVEKLAGKSTVVHCHHGLRSLKMTSLLRSKGLTAVHSMAGGVDLWSRDIDPAVPRY